MKTVGVMLKDARQARGLTLDEVETATKIRRKFLESIESDDYSKLPSVSYAKGFVKNYSDFLGLDSYKVLAFFRRQTVDATRSSILPKGVEEPLNRSPFQLTPGRFLALILSGLAFLFLLYFILQYRSYQNPPTLVIESPKLHEVVTDARIDVLGKTDPDATITIDGVSVLVRGDGKFFDQVTLEPGINKITIAATSRFGKTTTVVQEVGLKQPQTLTPPR